MVSALGRCIALRRWRALVVFSVPIALFSVTAASVGMGGICLGPATNNVVEYHAVIGLLTEASSFSICPT